ncbi:hypothetical protein P885DRAFT_77906 [Corynascus similis CBS 632.67]
MALASHSHCAHSFIMIKSDNTLIEWRCHVCHSGPFWFIWEFFAVSSSSQLPSIANINTQPRIPPPSDHDGDGAVNR